ncbi:MAG: arsenate reductase (glutaredoxin) [Alphaproteobacteria bacterium]|nr:arsenate reductase (glutaredoxin) [Alphaproteobacteria bacterium]
MTVTIYHNPRCTKCRLTLDLLEKKGLKPRVIEYLETPPSAAELKRILGLLKMKPAQLLRAKEAKEAGIDPDKLTDAQLIAKMVANPIVIQRPIVVADGKARIGRPPETVLEIL